MAHRTPAKRLLLRVIIRSVLGAFLLAISSSQELFAQSEARFQASAVVVATPAVMAAQNVTKTPAAMAFLEAQWALGAALLANSAERHQTTIGPAVVTVQMGPTVGIGAEPGIQLDGPWSTMPSVVAPVDVHVLVEFSAN